MSYQFFGEGNGVSTGSSSRGVVAACLGHSTVHVLDMNRTQKATDKAAGADYGGAFLPVDQGPHIPSLKICAGLPTKASACLLLGNELLAACESAVMKYNAKTGSSIWQQPMLDPPVKFLDISAYKPHCVLVVCRRSVLCLDIRQGEQQWVTEPYKWKDKKPIDDDNDFEKHCWIHDAALDCTNWVLWCMFGQHGLPLDVSDGTWHHPEAKRVTIMTRGLSEDQRRPDIMQYMLRDAADDVKQFSGEQARDVSLEFDDNGDLILPKERAWTRFAIAPKETYGSRILHIPAHPDISDSKDVMVAAGNIRGLFASDPVSGEPLWVHYPYWKCTMADIVANVEDRLSSLAVPFATRAVVAMQPCTVRNAPGASAPVERLLVVMRANWNVYCISVDTGVERWRASVSKAFGMHEWSDQDSFAFTDVEWLHNEPPPPPQVLHLCPERDMMTVATADGRMAFWRLGSGEHVASFTGGLFSGPQLGAESIAVDYPAGTQLALWPSARPNELDLSQDSWDTSNGKVKRAALLTIAMKHDFGDAMTKVTVLAAGDSGAAAGGNAGAGSDSDLANVFSVVPHVSEAPAPWTHREINEARVVSDALSGCGLHIAVDGFYRARSSTRTLALTKQIKINGEPHLLMAATDGILTCWRVGGAPPPASPRDVSPRAQQVQDATQQADASPSDGGQHNQTPQLTRDASTDSSADSTPVKASLAWRRTYKHYAPFKSQYCNPKHMRLLDPKYRRDDDVLPTGLGGAMLKRAQDRASGKAAEPFRGDPDPEGPLPGSAGSIPPVQVEKEKGPSVEPNRFEERLSRACLVNEGAHLFTISGGERHHTLRLWDVSNGELLKVFSAPAGLQKVSVIYQKAYSFLGDVSGSKGSLVCFSSYYADNRITTLHMVRAIDLNTLAWLPLHPPDMIPLEDSSDLHVNVDFIPKIGFVIDTVRRFQPRSVVLKSDVPMSDQVGGGEEALKAWGGGLEIYSRDELMAFGKTPVSVAFKLTLPLEPIIQASMHMALPAKFLTTREPTCDGDWSKAMAAALPVQHVNFWTPCGPTTGTDKYLLLPYVMMAEQLSLCPTRMVSPSGVWLGSLYAVGTRRLQLRQILSSVMECKFDVFDLAKAAFRDESPRPNLAFTWATLKKTPAFENLIFVVAPVLRAGQEVSTYTVIATIRGDDCGEDNAEPRLRYNSHHELPSVVTKLFFPEDAAVVAAVVPGEGIWLLDGPTLQPIKSYMYPFEGSVDTIELMQDHKAPTVLDKHVPHEHRKRMFILGADGQVQDVSLTDFFGRMAMARVVDLVEAEEAAATGQVDITGWFFYIGLISGMLLILLDFLQMASFAFSAATPPSLDSTAETVKQFQALGIVGVDVDFKLVYWLCVGVLGVFFAVFAASEAIEEYAFKRQESYVAQTVWTVVTVLAQLMTTVAVIPLVRVLSGAFDCIPPSADVEGLPWNAVTGQECFEGDHAAFLVISLLMLCVYLPIVVRLLLVGNDLTRVELLLSAPWDWSQDDRSEPPREHVLSLAASRFGPAQAIVKLLASIIYVLGGTRFTIGSSILVLMLGVGLMVLSYREPPYYNQTLNHVRSALDAGVVWTYIVAVVASIALDGDANVEKGGGLDITLTVLPAIILAVLPAVYFARHSGCVDACVNKMCIRSSSPVDDHSADSSALQSVVVHGDGGSGKEPADGKDMQAASDSVQENPVSSQDDTVSPPEKSEGCEAGAEAAGAAAAGAEAGAGAGAGAGSESATNSGDTSAPAEGGANLTGSEGAEAGGDADEAGSVDDDAVSLCSLSGKEKLEIAGPLPKPFQQGKLYQLAGATVTGMLSLCELQRPAYHRGAKSVKIEEEQRVKLQPDERPLCEWGAPQS